jgi:uncharacterized protein YacL
MHSFDATALTILAVSLILLLAVLYLTLKLLKFQAHLLIIIISGIVVGLLIGALASVPLAKLPGLYGQLLPIIVTLIITATIATLFARRAKGFASFWRNLPKQFMSLAGLKPDGHHPTEGRRVLVDTSVIVDGRIYDVAASGFLPAQMVVPRFVVKELQTISDSSDDLKRARGKRGLEILTKLRKEFHVEVITEDAPEVGDVDSKLVAVASRTGSDILTTDYNLNQVAQVEGIKVLNLNELSRSLRAVVLPGEEMDVLIVQLGKEKKQGVGYLPDGTMIVVEGGDTLIGKEIPVIVTRSLQTVAGKMIFAKPKEKKRGAKA